MKKRNILHRTLILLFLLCGLGIDLLVGSSFACGLGLTRENSKTSMIMTMITVPALQINRSITKTATATGNATALLTVTTDYDNSDMKSSSGKTWHTVETWTLVIPFTLFPLKDLLQSLHDVFDKIDDGLDDPDNPDAKIRNNIQTVQNLKIRMRRKIYRIRKFLIKVTETLEKA